MLGRNRLQLPDGKLGPVSWRGGLRRGFAGLDAGLRFIRGRQAQSSRRAAGRQPDQTGQAQNLENFHWNLFFH